MGNTQDKSVSFNDEVVAEFAKLSGLSENQVGEAPDTVCHNMFES